MSELLVMPKLGLTMEEGTLETWSIQVGDNVETGEPICEVETDKISAEVESPVSGILLRCIEPGLVVPVGEPIAVIGALDEDVTDVELFDPAKPAAKPTVQQSTPGSAPLALSPEPSRRERRPSSPVAKKLAKELGVDLSQVTGTGPGGRITRSDVEKAASTENAQEVLEKPSKMRRAIASTMIISATVPQFSLERDVVVGPLEESLAEIASTESEERRPTVPDAIFASLAGILTNHPNFLRSWKDEGYVRHERVNIGVAVEVPEGLLVPVIEDADQLSMCDVAAARRHLQKKATENSLAASEITGAVFTVSNLGPFGIDRFRALVNPPESGILAIGRTIEREGKRLMTLNLSADHRVVDGADGARLLADLANELEESG